MNLSCLPWNILIIILAPRRRRSGSESRIWSSSYTQIYSERRSSASWRTLVAGFPSPVPHPWRSHAILPPAWAHWHLRSTTGARRDSGVERRREGHLECLEWFHWNLIANSMDCKFSSLKMPHGLRARVWIILHYVLRTVWDKPCWQRLISSVPLGGQYNCLPFFLQ